MRWIMKLQILNLVIRYRSGKDDAVADWLSYAPSLLKLYALGEAIANKSVSADYSTKENLSKVKDFVCSLTMACHTTNMQARRPPEDNKMNEYVLFCPLRCVVV